MFENILFFPFGFRACAFPLRFLTCRIPIGFQVVQAVAVYALRPYPVCEGEPADLGLAQPEQAHDVEARIPVFRKVVAQPFRFLRHSPVNLRFRETLGGVGFDARYRVPHTEVVEPSVGIIELLAYLCHRIKVSADTFPVRESITHGLLIVCRRNEPPFCRAAICSFLSLLSDKGCLPFAFFFPSCRVRAVSSVVCISSFIFPFVFFPCLANIETLRLQ